MCQATAVKQWSLHSPYWRRDPRGRWSLTQLAGSASWVLLQLRCILVGHTLHNFAGATIPCRACYSLSLQQPQTPKTLFLSQQTSFCVADLASPLPLSLPWPLRFLPQRPESGTSACRDRGYTLHHHRACSHQVRTCTPCAAWRGGAGCNLEGCRFAVALGTALIAAHPCVRLRRWKQTYIEEI